MPSPTSAKVLIGDLMIKIEAEKKGVKVGEDVVSKLMLTDESVGISGTLQGLQKQMEKALKYTGKWRMTTNVNKCAVLVYYGEKKPVTSNGSGEKELPIVNRCSYPGVNVSRTLLGVYTSMQ